MIRGAVYPVDLGDAKRGHEQRGRRLGLVISIEQNAWSPVTIIPTSTSAQAFVFRPEAVIAGRDTKIRANGHVARPAEADHASLSCGRLRDVRAHG